MHMGVHGGSEGGSFRGAKVEDVLCWNHIGYYLNFLMEGTTMVAVCYE